MSNTKSTIAPRIDHSQQHQSDKLTITKIVTSKEWVLPPRPKPGRKPSIDTPSTKRKAQNRALQRLFRERRANRVGELEEKLLEIEKERSIKEGLMSNHIKNLTMENIKLKKTVQDLNKRLNVARGNGSSSSTSTASSKTSPMLDDDDAQRTVNYISPVSSAAASPNVLNNEVVRQELDCGVCMKDDCLCQSHGIKMMEMDKFKPVAAVPLKKRKHNDDENEMDFTERFRTRKNQVKKMPDLSKLQKGKVSLNQGDLFKTQDRSIVNQLQPLRLVEEEANCGFCSDDTPCVCRELAKEVENLQLMNEEMMIKEQQEQMETSLPPLKNVSRHNSLPVLHPGPSVEFTSKSSSTPVILSATKITESGGCTGNPGTCSQCQMDPMSTLFCTSILNKEGQQQEQRQQGKDDDDVFISTADAYKTLSRHQNFKKINFNTLIGKLTTRGMLVEAGSVAGVLRELDRKFSSGGR